MNHLPEGAAWGRAGPLAPAPARPPAVGLTWTRAGGERMQPGAGSGETGLAEAWRILSKWRWVAAACLAGALALGAAATVLTLPLYRASATVQIDREASRIVNVQDVQPSSPYEASQEFYETQYALLKSRSLAQKVAQLLHLADDPAFLAQYDHGLVAALRRHPRGRAATHAQREAAAAGLVEANLVIAPVRDSRLVQVGFQSPDPATASRVANAVAESFITTNLERRYDASSYARQFLEQRLGQVKEKLEASERQLVAYASRQQIINVPTGAETGGATPSAGAGQSLVTSNLVALNTALNAAKADRIGAEQRWSEAQAGTGENLPEVLSSAAITALRASRADIQTKYSQDLSTFKPDYPSMVARKAEVSELDKEIAADIATVRDSIRIQYETAVKHEASLQAQVDQLKGAFLDQYNKSIEYNILQREVDSDRTLYDGLLQRYKEIGVAGGVGTNNISIVDRAETPGGPFKPQPLRNLEVSALIGLLVGGVLIFGLEKLDETVLAPNTVEARLGTPLLGVIPVLRKIEPLAALVDRRSALSEAYYSARTALQFSTSEGAPRTLVVTSARPGEGKSTTALALAQNFARLGVQVMLVDADLRNPSVHRLMDRPNEQGLSSYLTGLVGLEEVVQRSPDPNLFLLTSGPVPPNPAELLAGRRFAELLVSLAELCEMVVLDSPPVMGLADAPLLASAAAGTLFVMEAGRARAGLARMALGRLRSANAHLVGCILTKFNARRVGYGPGHAYGFDYGYGYGRDAFSYGQGADPALQGRLEAAGDA